MPEICRFYGIVITFSLYIDEATKNQEIQSDINSPRRMYKSTDIYAGFSDLANRSRNDCK